MNGNHCAWYSINLSTQTGSLERLMGRIRRRGFQVENMMVTHNSFTGGYRVEVRVAGSRCVKTLARHIAHLVDVSTVSLHVSSAPVEYATSVPTGPVSDFATS